MAAGKSLKRIEAHPFANDAAVLAPPTIFDTLVGLAEMTFRYVASGVLLINRGREVRFDISEDQHTLRTDLHYDNKIAKEKRDVCKNQR